MNTSVNAEWIVNYSIFFTILLFGSVLSLLWVGLPYFILLFHFFHKSYQHIRDFPFIRWYINLLEKRCEDFKLEKVLVVAEEKQRVELISFEKQLNAFLYTGKLKNDRKVTIKKIPKKEKKLADNETSTLVQCDGHSNIIRYFMKEEDEEHIYIIFEHFSKTLQEWFDFGTKDRISIFHQISKGIQHLHSLNILHCNIHPESIFVINDNTIKLGNFEKSKPAKQMDFQTDIIQLGKLFQKVLLEKKATTLDEDLIENILNNYSTIEQVLKHSLFWEEKKKLNLISDASAYLCSQTSEDAIQMNQHFESKKNEIFEKEWNLKIDVEIISNVTKFRKYDFSKLIDLIRFIRNINSHLNEYDLKVQEILLRNGIFKYFDKKFPNLFSFIFRNLQTCKNLVSYNKYYL
jgi:serine/threonine-protein kinase/endoribonuclease IRE1